MITIYNAMGRGETHKFISMGAVINFLRTNAGYRLYQTNINENDEDKIKIKELETK